MVGSVDVTDLGDTPEEVVVVHEAGRYLAAIDGLDEELQTFITDPATAPLDVLESIQDTGDFEINFSDAFTEARG